MRRCQHLNVNLRCRAKGVREVIISVPQYPSLIILHLCNPHADEMCEAISRRKSPDERDGDFMTIIKKSAHLGVENAYLSNRLREIAKIIGQVDNRCMASDGPVSNTRAEMTDEEMRQIYRLALDKPNAR